MKLILPREIATQIQPQLPNDVSVVWNDSDGNLDSDANDAEVYLSWFYYLKPSTLDRVLTAAPSLRWHHAPNAGVNHILTPKYLERDLILTNGAGVHGIPIAEFVIAYMLAHNKQLHRLYRLQAEHNWDREFPERKLLELWDKTLLIIGAGGIGQEIAVRAKAFGMRIFGSRVHPQPLANFDQIVGVDDWQRLLPEADYVVVATPLTEETKGLINEQILRLMHPQAYLINIARGGIVDESALATALEGGWIAGAALDTVSTEPLPPESKLWSLPNLLITPHCSGHSPRSQERSLALFLDNLTRYRQGKPLLNVVDKKAGY